MIVKNLVRVLNADGNVFINDLGLFQKEFRSAKIGKTEIQPPHFVVTLDSQAEGSGFAFILAMSNFEQMKIVDADTAIREWTKQLLDELQASKHVHCEGFGSFSLKKGAIVFESDFIPELNSEYEGMQPVSLADEAIAAPVVVATPAVEPAVTPELPSPVAEHETDLEPEPELVSQPILEVVPPVVQEVAPAAEVVIVAEPEPVPEPELESEPEPESAPVLQPEPEPELESAPEPESAPALQPEPEAESVPAPILTPELPPQTVESEADVTTSQNLESIAEFPPTTQVEPKVPEEISSVKLDETAQDTHSYDFPAAQNPEPTPDTDVAEPAEQDDVSHVVLADDKPRHSHRWIWILIIILVLLGGIGAAGYFYRAQIIDLYHHIIDKEVTIESANEHAEGTSGEVAKEAVTTETSEIQSDTCMILEEPAVEEVEQFSEPFDINNVRHITFQKGKFYVVHGSFGIDTDCVKHIKQMGFAQYNPTILQENADWHLRVCLGVFNSESQAEAFAAQIRNAWVKSE